jgi:hypothetical protein
LVRELGVDVRYRYHLVSAIAASVPVTALEGLRRNPNVTVVEPDGTVQAIDAEPDAAWGVKTTTRTRRIPVTNRLRGHGRSGG